MPITASNKTDQRPTEGATALAPGHVVGLVGRGIQLSRTPEMHMAEAAAQGLRLVYQTLDTDRLPSTLQDLPAIIAAAEAFGFAGLNITYPFKVAVISELHALSDNARRVGSVNTVVFRSGRRLGHNTDLWGFAESFRRNMAGAAIGSVLQVGAGGAGAAVAHALADCGVGQLTIADTDLAKAERLSSEIAGAATRARAVPVEAIGDEDADGIVNATPVGTAAMPGSPYPTDRLKPEMWVADIVYFPLETRLLAEARKRGCRVLSGSGMAVFQAVRAFELFTGRPPDPKRMQATFDAFDS